MSGVIGWIQTNRPIHQAAEWVQNHCPESVVKGLGLRKEGGFCVTNGVTLRTNRLVAVALTPGLAGTAGLAVMAISKLLWVIAEFSSWVFDNIAYGFGKLMFRSFLPTRHPILYTALVAISALALIESFCLDAAEKPTTRNSSPPSESNTEHPAAQGTTGGLYPNIGGQA